MRPPPAHTPYNHNVRFGIEEGLAQITEPSILYISTVSAANGALKRD